MGLKGEALLVGQPWREVQQNGGAVGALRKEGGPRTEDLVWRGGHFLQIVRARIAGTGWIELEQTDAGASKGGQHAFSIGAVADKDARLHEPGGVQSTEPSGHGSQVLRARSGTARVQFDADGGTFEDGGKGGQLHTAAAGHVQHDAGREALGVEQSGTFRTHLPRGRKGFGRLTMNEMQSVRRGRIPHSCERRVRLQLGGDEHLVRHGLTL